MQSSRRRNPSESMNQQESEGSDMDRCMEANESEESVDKMLLWSCLTSYIVLTRKTGAVMYVALRDHTSCSWVKMDQKLCGLMRA